MTTPEPPGGDALTEAEVAAALEAARRLIRAGVPMFVAPPDSTQKSGYKLPPNWHTSIPQPDVVNRWRPGWALCAVGGHVCDFLDVDVQNGGHHDETGLRHAGMWPVSYGRARTPSGGTHDIIAPLRMRKGKVTDGIDYQGGLPEPDEDEETGRGFVFVSPTVRVSKTDEVIRPYRWVVEPDMDLLADNAESDDSGQQIAELIGVRSTKGKTGPQAPGSPTAAPSDPVGLLRVRVAAFEALTSEGSNRTQELDNLALLAGHGVPRYWSAEAARDRLLAAAAANGYIGVHGKRDALVQIESGLTDGAAKPWVPVDPGEQAFRTEVAYEKRRLKVRDEAQRQFRAEQGAALGAESGLVVSGGTFIHAAPVGVPAVWGRGDEVLWSLGEPVMISGPTGVGKALRNDQPVLTPTGWVPIGKLCVGDEVVGSSGHAVTVTGVYPQGVRELFEVMTSDGVSIIADADHLWLTQTTTDRMNGHSHWAPNTTAEIAESLTVPKAGRERTNHYLPMLKAPVEGVTAECPLDPWLVGVLIGDGGLSGSSVTLSNPDPMLLDHVRDVLPEGVSLQPQAKIADGKDWRVAAVRGQVNPVLNALRDLGLQGCRSHEKTIPESLLYGSADQRLALLNGLLDTDGSCYGVSGTTVEYSTSSPFLAEQIPWLAQSLGGTVRINHRPAPGYTYKGEKRIGRPSWRVRMSLPAEIPPFAYSTKAARYKPRSKYPPRRQIVSVTRVADDLATCISVDASDQLYVTAGCVLTHNTTLGGQVVAARMGLIPDVLGYPVVPGRRVLYLAMDRPAQIARALARLLRQFPRDVLDERIVFWRGPPPADLGTHPHTLLELAQRYDADTVVLDSLKDAAINLSDEAVGQGFNRAMQSCTASGVEVICYHHQTKRGNGGISKPNSLADVYGSGWITAGCGSVVLLWGEAGDPIVELSHLKPVATAVGPLTLLHDPIAGTMTVVEGSDVLDLLLSFPRTAAEVATALYGATNPSKAQVEKARRKIARLVDKGLAVRLGEPSSGGGEPGRRGGGEGARYGAAVRVGDPPRSLHVSVHALHENHENPSFPQVNRSTHDSISNRSTFSVHGSVHALHEKDVSAGQSVHASVHAQNGAASLHADHPPLLRRGVGVKRGDLETAADLDGGGDRWVHAHLTTAPQTVDRLAADLDASAASVASALARLETIGHAKCCGVTGTTESWSLPDRNGNVDS